MSGKIQGDLDGSAGKVLGGLEKPPSDDLADLADTSSYASSSGSYYGGGGSGGHRSDSDTGEDSPAADAGQDTADDDDDVEPGDEAGADDGDAPGDEAPEMWTQPGEHRLGDESGNSSDDGGSSSGQVSIDIQAMTMLIAAMERARDQILEFQAEFRKILTDVDLFDGAYPEPDRLPEVAAWIDEELPGLRRRLALAQAIEGDGDGLQTLPDRQPRFRAPIAYDEQRVPDHPPHISVEHGREAVALLTAQPDQDPVPGLIAKLRGNEHDPYFAHRFTSDADPAAVAALIDAAARPDTDRTGELSALVTATIRTAARGTGQLAPGENFDEQWGRFAQGGGRSAASA